MEPIFFATQTDFRKWLKKNHTKETELIVGFYKVGAGKPGNVAGIAPGLYYLKNNSSGAVQKVVISR